MKNRGYLLLAVLLGSVTGWIASSRLDSDVISPIVATSETRSSYREFFFPREGRGEFAKHIGKNHDRVKEPFRDIIAPANASTVRLFSKSEPLALGIVISSDGLVVTKASELKEPLRCRVPGGREYRAETLAISGDTDLALLRIPVRGLQPCVLADVPSPTGTWVAVPGGRGDLPLVLGVISTRNRPIPEERAVLGVMLAETDDGPRIDQVLERSIAAQIGLEAGDVIRSLNSEPLRRSRHLVERVATLRPGDRVELEVVRKGVSRKLEARLGRISELMFAESEFERELDFGLSVRRSGFSEVLQHDAAISAQECGGPLVDVEGRVVGLNIARSGRVATFALPARVVLQEIRVLKAKAGAMIREGQR